MAQLAQHPILVMGYPTEVGLTPQTGQTAMGHQIQEIAQLDRRPIPVMVYLTEVVFSSLGSESKNSDI